MWANEGPLAGRALPGRSVVLVAFLLAVGLFPAARAGEEPADPLAVSAVEFCGLFMDGEDERAGGMMAGEMRSAVTPAVAEQIRASLTGPNGALKRLGDAWKEDEVQGYVRYRVPAEFEKATLDLRVVFDGEGKVAGFFQVPHVEPPGRESEDGTETVPAEPDPALEGHWEGAIEIPGQALPVRVDLRFADGAWTGTFDSPMQGATGIPLGDIAVDADHVRFGIEGVPGTPTFDGTLKDEAIRGTFTQAGQSFSFELGREEVALPERPQEPQPPLSYEQQDVGFANGEVRLACTLTMPSGEGPFPAAMLLTGSGPQDRDELVFGHRPFLVLADHLTRAGIAVLRCDDRGVGGSTGSVGTATSDELAGDALAGVRFLAEQPRIDAARIGLIGHSEGGIVGPLAASRSDRVAFVVMLAGTGVPGDEVLVRQVELLMRAGGADPETIEAALAAQRQLLDRVRRDAAEPELQESYRRLASIQLAASSAELDDDGLGEIVAQGVRELSSPWFRYFLEHDPRPVLRELRVPVLALNGEIDLQVDPDQNLPAIREALAKGSSPDVTVKEMPGLNHLFQKAATGAVDEYGAIEETINPTVLETVATWILERFGHDSESERSGTG